MSSVSNFKNKGVSLYLTLVILGILLAAALGLAAVLLGQIKTIKGVGDSVVALYAADSGIEKALDDEPPLPSYGPTSINEASYEVSVKCCLWSDSWCLLDQDECSGFGTGLTEDSSCVGSYFCYKSIGTYRETKRAIEITR